MNNNKRQFGQKIVFPLCLQRSSEYRILLGISQFVTKCRRSSAIYIDILRDIDMDSDIEPSGGSVDGVLAKARL